MNVWLKLAIASLLLGYFAFKFACAVGEKRDPVWLQAMAVMGFGICAAGFIAGMVGWVF